MAARFYTRLDRIIITDEIGAVWDMPAQNLGHSRSSADACMRALRFAFVNQIRVVKVEIIFQPDDNGEVPIDTFENEYFWTEYKK